MTLQNLLETFEQGKAPSKKAPAELDAADVEAIRSAAFEAGYASGWEDAQKADAEAQNRVTAEFERNIQNLVFTYSEAVDCVRGELKGFVSAVIEGFLPEVATDLTREHIRTELLKIADDLVEVPVEIVTSPDCKPLLEKLLENDFSLDIRLIEDATLAPLQVYIRIGEREIEVNVDPLVDALRTQFQAVAETGQERIVNG